MPLAVVGIFATFIVWLIATIPVAIEILFLLLPWSLGWIPTVNVPLARMLFWFFGHPLVYFWLLPTYVMYYTMLPKLAGGKLVLRFRGPPHLSVARALLRAGRDSSPIHRAGNQQHLEVRSRVLDDAGGGAKPRDRVHSCRLDGTWRPHKGGRGLFGWWKKLPYLDRTAGFSVISFAASFIFIFGGVTGIINASYNLDTSCTIPRGFRRIFIRPSPAPRFPSYIGMSLSPAGETDRKEDQISQLRTCGCPTSDAWHHDLFDRAVYRRCRRRTAAHEHGIDLHQSALAALSRRLAGGENAREHRRNDHDHSPQ